MGIWTPCLISACLVVLRRHLRRRQQASAPLPLQRRQRRIEVEIADDVAHRDAQSGVEASRRQVDRVASARRPDACRGWPSRPGPRGTPVLDTTPCPLTTMALGKAQVRGVAVGGRHVEAKPHWMPRSRVKFRLVTTIRASISTCGVGRSSSAISSLDRLQEAREVLEQHGVGPFVHVDGAASRERTGLLQDVRQRLRLRVGDARRELAELAGELPSRPATCAGLALPSGGSPRRAMRMTLPSSVYPRPLALRMRSRAWSQGTSLSLRVTLPLTPGLTTTFMPLMSANSRKMSCRSPSLKSRLIGCPVKTSSPVDGGGRELRRPWPRRGSGAVLGSGGGRVAGAGSSAGDVQRGRRSQRLAAPARAAGPVRAERGQGRRLRGSVPSPNTILTPSAPSTM